MKPPAQIAAKLTALVLSLVTTVSAQPVAKPIRTFAGHLGAVTMADFTPDGAALGTSSADHQLKIWDVATGDALATLSGNAAPVSAMAISPDGMVLASGARDNTIKLWDIPQTKPVRTFVGHQAATTAFAFNANATRFATASQDKSVRIWDTESSAEPLVLSGHSTGATAVAYRLDENQIASGDAAGLIRLWRTLDRRPEGRLGAHRGGVTSLFYHSNSRQLISTGADGLAKVWQLPIVAPEDIASESFSVDLATVSLDGQLVATTGRVDNRPAVVIRQVSDGAMVATLFGHEGPITSLAFNANHTRLVTGSEDQTVRVWDFAKAEAPELLQYTDHGGAVRAVGFADTATVVSGGADQKIHHWNFADGKLLRALEGHAGEISALAVSATVIASASTDGTVRLWNKSNGAALRTIEHGAPVTKLAVSNDNARIASWGSDHQLKLWQQSDGVLVTAIADIRDLTSLSFSPNSQQLAASLGQEARVWHAAGGDELQFFPGPAQPSRAVAFLPDSKTLLSVDAENGLRRAAVAAIRVFQAHPQSVVDAASYQGGNMLATVARDGVVKLWATSNGQLAREMTVAEASLISLATSVNNQFVAAGADDGRVFLWNAGNGSLTAEFSTPAAAQSISLSNEPAMKLAVAGADRGLRFYAVKDQALLQSRLVDSPIRRLAFLPDNARVAAAHESGVVAHYAFASPEFTRNMTGHSGGVFNLVFSPDGKTLVSASADKTVRLWDPIAGRQIRALSGHTGSVFGLALTTDSSWIVSAGGDSTIRLWDRLSGRQLKQIDAPGALYTVAMHADGQTVAAAGIDRKVYVYDVFAGTLKGTLEGHPDYIYRVAFNHAGNRLLSCGYGGHLIVWEFPSGKQLHATRAQGVLNSVAYSPDDAQVVVASDNGTAQLLDLPPHAR